jgi:hypothetical protein
MVTIVLIYVIILIEGDNLGKLASCEKFFLNKIAFGFEIDGYSLGQSDIEILFGGGVKREEEFVKRIKNSLTLSYSSELDGFKCGTSASDPSVVWEEQVIKLYKGRETLLRDIVVEWYSRHTRPGFLDIIKNIFSGKR